LDVSDIADYSSVNESAVEMAPIQFNMPRLKVYNLSYPIKTIEFFEGPEPFRIGKRDKDLNEFLEEQLDRPFTCKHIIYNNTMQLPKIQDKTLLYTTNEEFINADGVMFDEIKLHELTRSSKHPVKYLVQAISDRLNKKEGADGPFTAGK
jgi:hypothetical protein